MAPSPGNYARSYGATTYLNQVLNITLLFYCLDYIAMPESKSPVRNYR